MAKKGAIAPNYKTLQNSNHKTGKLAAVIEFCRVYLYRTYAIKKVKSSRISDRTRVLPNPQSLKP